MSKATEMRSELPDWEALRRGIDGEVALPGSPAYRASRPPFNARFRDVLPLAIVSCASPEDAAEAVSLARRHPLELATRAGGTASRPTPRPGACSSTSPRCGR
jgi:FAD/FMN-containing dehydrogenase